MTYTFTEAGTYSVWLKIKWDSDGLPDYALFMNDTSTSIEEIVMSNARTVLTEMEFESAL